MVSSSLLNILIVEDETLIGLDVQEGLEAAGFGALWVACPLAATALLEARHPTFAALVTDIRLGSKMTGWDVAHFARKKQDSLPVVYMSGDSAHDHDAFGVPDSVMIQKPFVIAKIVTALTALLNRRPASPSH